MSALPDSAKLEAEDYALIGAQQVDTRPDGSRASQSLNKAVRWIPRLAEVVLPARPDERSRPSIRIRAVIYFRQAIRHDPKKPLYFLNLGVAHFQTEADR